MVRRVPKDVMEAVDRALAAAKTRTDAEIIVVVTPRSDHYEAQVTALGLAAGSLLAFGLWAAHIVTAFPWLLSLQIAAMLLANVVPTLHGLCIRAIPRRVRHHQAARRAMQEYLLETHNLPAEKAAVMLYVSLAERYVHILHSRAVPQKVAPQAWDAVVSEFTAAMKSKTRLRDACAAAIGDIANALAPGFPATPRRD